MDNVKIAEFMGYEHLIFDKSIYVCKKGSGEIKKYKNFLSSEGLMEVVEFIENLPVDKEKGEEFQFFITGETIGISRFDDGSGVISSRLNEIGKSKLQPIREVILEFIDWYSLTNKQP